MTVHPVVKFYVGWKTMSKLNGVLLMIILITAVTLGLTNGSINLTIHQVQEGLKSVLELVVAMLLSNFLTKKFDDAS
jgi:hypothetical protein